MSDGQPKKMIYSQVVQVLKKTVVEYGYLGGHLSEVVIQIQASIYRGVGLV